MKKNWNFRVFGFFAAVYLASGLLWIPILISGKGMSNPLNMIPMALITWVPSIAGVVFTYIVKDRAGRRDFWRRIFRWPTAPRGILIAALVMLPLMNITAYALSFLLAGKNISFAYAKELFSSAPMLLQFIAVEAIFGPLSEELGWRGYVLDELQSKWGALKSALVLGVLWGFWHTPAFLVPGLVQYNMGGVFSTYYLSFFFSAVSGSVLHTWVFNNTGRSTLVAGILMHFLFNASLVLLAGNFDQFSVPDGYWTIALVINVLVAAVVAASWRRKTLNCQSIQPEIHTTHIAA